MNVLTCFTAHGCEACEAAKPELEAFKRANYGKVIVVQADVTVGTISLTGIKIRATPTYELTNERHESLKKFEGGLDVEHLNKFVFGKLGDVK